MKRFLIPFIPILSFFLICSLSGNIYRQIVNPEQNLKLENISIDTETGLVNIDQSTRPPDSDSIKAVHLPAINSHVKNPLNQTTYLEFKYRLLWSVSVIFFFFSFICIVAVIASIINHLNLSWTFTMVSFSATCILGYILYETSMLPFTDDNFFNEILFHPLKKMFSNFGSYVETVENLGFATLLLLAFTSMLILKSAANINYSKSENKILALARKQKYLRYLLYFGVFALVAGTIEVSALYTWAMQFISPGEITLPFTLPSGKNTLPYFNSSDEVVRGFSLANGVFYSMLVASIFVPSFAIMNSFAHNLAMNEQSFKTAKEETEWLKENNLIAGLPQQMLQIGLALAPALVGGPLIGLLEAVG